MKFGFLSAIMDGWSFEEVIDFAAEHHYDCVELAAWPLGESERRYAGVSHLDADRALRDDAYCREILAYLDKKKVTISALAFYPNTMDSNPEKRAANIGHLKKVILASARLNIHMVTTFVGRDQSKTTEENYRLFDEIWPDIIRFAEAAKVKIAIENCPMLFGPDQWPGGQNLMCTPVIWRELFRRFPGEYFGLNFDPSHFVWQKLDYIQPIYEFKDKIFHIHFKDIKIHPRLLEQYGILSYPLDYMSPKIPGLGDVDWGKFISALTDIGYQGPACIEIEDKAFENGRNRIVAALEQSQRYLSPYLS